jgi:putative sterol carrier protein
VIAFSYGLVAMSALAAIGDRFDAATLARLARRTPEPLLRAATIPPLRTVVIGGIFRRMPSQLKAGAAPPDTVIRWDIGDADRLESWFLVFEEGRCRSTTRPPETMPRTTLTVSPLDFLRLAAGTELPMAMFQSGRIKISGDLFFAAQLQGMFEIPSARR